MAKIKYRKVPKSERTNKRQKYELLEVYERSTGIELDNGGRWVKIPCYITLFPLGDIIIQRGYRWDGPSFIAIDTPDFMRASLVHDALYQLMREGKLDIKHREAADQELYNICVEDGMWKIRAWWCYQFVRLFADKAAKGK